MLLVKAFSLADFDTYATKNAGERITCPSGCFFVHCDALGRAFNGTDAAEGAIFDVVVQLSPHIFKGRSYFVGVTAGGLA